ncbi:flagellar motor protein MotB [Desulfosarcina sp.]|uniref:OmpA/MotB family protein n=1 Tax=Desulfosarcina sp. TaxID=2027861 RepID=UPI003564CB94
MVDNAGQSMRWRFKPNADKGIAVRFSLAEEAKSAEEDAFLWSMADLMTLLLVFFVLLYTNAINRPETPLQESDQAVTTVASSSGIHSDVLPEATSTASTPTDETMAPNPEPPATNRASHKKDPVEPLNRAMINDLKDSFSNDFYVRWDEKRPVFVLGERITFNIGEAMLLAGSQSALKRIAHMIAPQRHYQIIVSGHTDDIAIRTQRFPSNWELSAARAASVAKFLATHGIAPQRLIIQGKSEFHPLVANTSDENRRANRRVEISLVKVEQTPDPLQKGLISAPKPSSG